MKEAEYKPLPKLSNPRKDAMIEDWPIGRNRCRCHFFVETHPKRGERVIRETENKTRTGWNKPKKLTYATCMVVVDGDDGKTYILSWHKDWHHLTLWSGDMKLQLKTIYEEDHPCWGEWLSLVAPLKEV